MSSWTSERARVASLSRSRTPNDPDLLAARDALRVARLRDAIEKAVNSAPPLTDEQRLSLARILTAPSAA
jgi:hypothetical protein